MINIYTDGSSTKTRSGWGWYLPLDPPIGCAGQEKGATNQRMELMAALQALNYWYEFHSNDDVTIWTDSAYLHNCYLEKWYINWENNGWVNSKGEPVANKDLWINLITFFRNPQVNFGKVKGHSGCTYNEMADKVVTGDITIDRIPNFKIDEESDRINIEISEILMDYTLKKYPVDETIKRIRKACKCE